MICPARSLISLMLISIPVGIGLTAEYKVSHIIAAGAVKRGAFFTEKPAIFFRGKFRGKQSARSGKFDAFADSKEHKRANMLPVIVQGSVSEHRHSCLCAQRRFSQLFLCSNFGCSFRFSAVQLRWAHRLGSLCSDQQREKLGTRSRVLFERAEQTRCFHDRVLLLHAAHHHAEMLRLDRLPRRRGMQRLH